MAPLLLAFEPGLHSAHLQASQNLASHAGSTTDPINATGMGTIFNHAWFRQPQAHRNPDSQNSAPGMTKNNKNMIVAYGPSTAQHDAVRENKLWQ